MKVPSRRWSLGSLVACLAAAMAATACVGAGLAQTPVDLEAARRQFVTSCGTCHAVEAGAPARQGPNLNGVYGRRAGTLPDFRYSPALQGADIVWTEATLDPWIENAQAMRAGTIMNYRQADPAKRRLIIAFLKSISPQ